MKPTLSLLLPTYNYPKGYERIIRTLPMALCFDIEVIVGDDSNLSLEPIRLGDDVDCRFPIKYHHNIPSKGAVYNWNDLISKATAPYILIMHHDEFPIGKEFWGKLLMKLKDQNYFDVILLRCVIDNNSIGIHSSVLSCFAAIRFPRLLYTYNVIGPMSCFVVKRSIVPDFDVNLRWLVDVDWYYSVFKIAESVSICSLKVMSEIRSSGSITASIASNVRSIKAREINYLAKKNSFSSIHANLFFVLGIMLRSYDRFMRMFGFLK